MSHEYKTLYPNLVPLRAATKSEVKSEDNTQVWPVVRSGLSAFFVEKSCIYSIRNAN